MVEVFKKILEFDNLNQTVFFDEVFKDKEGFEKEFLSIMKINYMKFENEAWTDPVSEN